MIWVIIKHFLCYKIDFLNLVLFKITQLTLLLDFCHFYWIENDHVKNKYTITDSLSSNVYVHTVISGLIKVTKVKWNDQLRHFNYHISIL